MTKEVVTLDPLVYQMIGQTYWSADPNEHHRADVTIRQTPEGYRLTIAKGLVRETLDYTELYPALKLACEMREFMVKDERFVFTAFAITDEAEAVATEHNLVIDRSEGSSSASDAQPAER